MVLTHVLGSLFDELFILGELVVPGVLENFVEFFGVLDLFEALLVLGEFFLAGLLAMGDVVSDSLPVYFALLALFFLDVFLCL